MKLLGIYNNQYKIDECLNIQHFINKLHFNVKSDVETTIDHIKKGLIIQNDSYMPIQKSIDLIAKNLNELKLYNEKTTIKCDNKNQ